MTSLQLFSSGTSRLVLLVPHLPKPHVLDVTLIRNSNLNSFSRHQDQKIRSRQIENTAWWVSSAKLSLVLPWHEQAKLPVYNLLLIFCLQRM